MFAKGHWINLKVLRKIVLEKAINEVIKPGSFSLKFDIISSQDVAINETRD